MGMWEVVIFPEDSRRKRVLSKRMGSYSWQSDVCSLWWKVLDTDRSRWCVTVRRFLGRPILFNIWTTGSVCFTVCETWRRWWRLVGKSKLERSHQILGRKSVRIVRSNGIVFDRGSTPVRDWSGSLWGCYANSWPFSRKWNWILEK